MPRVKVTIPDKTSQPYRFNLDHEKVRIGRSGDCDIVIDTPSVSGLHATMERIPGGYILKDQGSTNGITLDDKLMKVIDLNNGDDVKVGDASFDYLLSVEEQDELDTENFVPHEKSKYDADHLANDTDLEEDHGEDERVEQPKSTKMTTPNSRPSPSPMAARTMGVPSSSGGGIGFLGSVAAIILSSLAFFAGMDKSYVKAEKEKGRSEASLLKDIRDGRPALADPEKSEE